MTANAGSLFWFSARPHGGRTLFLLLITGVLICVQACTRILTGEQTVYAPRYSESNFDSLAKGQSKEQVEKMLGVPLGVITQGFTEVWSYAPEEISSSLSETHSEDSLKYDLFGPYTHLAFDERGIVKSVSGDYLKGSFIGKTQQKILDEFGSPYRKQSQPYAIIYRYTLPGKSGTYKVRNVLFDKSGELISTDAHIHYD